MILATRGPRLARTAEVAVNQRSYVSTHRPDYYIEAPKQQLIEAPKQQLIEAPKPDSVAQARSGFAEAQRALNRQPIDVYAGMTEGERAEAIAKWNATKLAAYQTVTNAISSTYQYFSNLAYGTPTPPTETKAVTVVPPGQANAVTIPPNNDGRSDDPNGPRSLRMARCSARPTTIAIRINPALRKGKKTTSSSGRASPT